MTMGVCCPECTCGTVDLVLADETLWNRPAVPPLGAFGATGATPARELYLIRS
jgi:hypothetical protein